MTTQPEQILEKKAKTLRDRIAYVNDNGETKTVELIDQIDWCKNRF